MHTCDHISLQNSQGVSPASHDHIVYSLWRKQYSAHERCSQWFAAHLTQLLEAHKELRFFQLSDEKWENSKTKNKGSREGAHIHHYSVGVVAGVDRPQSDIDDIQVKRKWDPVDISEQEPRVILFHGCRISCTVIFLLESQYFVYNLLASLPPIELPDLLPSISIPFLSPRDSGLLRPTHV